MEVRMRGLVLESVTFPLRFEISRFVVVEDQDGKEVYGLNRPKRYRDASGKRPDIFNVPEGEFMQMAVLPKDAVHEDAGGECTVVFVYKEEDGVTYARRGDSAIVFLADASSDAAIAEIQERMRERRQDPAVREGEEYVWDIDGCDMYGAATGVWDVEERTWCID